MKTEDKVKAVLKELRPALQQDGGDVNLVKIEKGRAVIRLKGACAGCPFSSFTLKDLIEAEIKKRVPEIREVTTD